MALLVCVCIAEVVTKQGPQINGDLEFNPGNGKYWQMKNTQEWETLACS